MMMTFLPKRAITQCSAVSALQQSFGGSIHANFSKSCLVPGLVSRIDVYMRPAWYVLDAAVPK